MTINHSFLVLVLNDRSELPITGGVDPRSDNPSKLPVNILEPYNLVFVRIKSECLVRLVAQKFEANREYAKHIFDLAVCGCETSAVNGEKIVFLDYCFSCDAVITVKSRLNSTKYSITAFTIICNLMSTCATRFIILRIPLPYIIFPTRVIGEFNIINNWRLTSNP